MMKHRGMTKLVFTQIENWHGQPATQEELLNAFPNSEPSAVLNAANYLAREGRIQRDGYAGHFTYRSLPEDTTAVVTDAVQAIDALLEVMANAEPHLKWLRGVAQALSEKPSP